MSTPSEKHSVKDVLLLIADTLEEYRSQCEYHKEAAVWATLLSFAASMEQSASSCAKSWDNIKSLMEKLPVV